ncbi:MAG: glycosyltransferase, partial [Candidatus Eremiobacterota bacterium]
CGRNEEKLREVEAFAPSVSFPVHPRPFVNMRDYYHAADVVLTKPGGLTSTEVLARGKPMVLVSPYPGMEETNVQRLTQAGVAVFGESPEKAADLAADLLTDPARREKLTTAAASFVHKDAARRIAQDLVASRRP